MLEGVNAVTYGKVIPSAPHANVVSDTCAGCHMQPIATTDPAFTKAGGHTFKMSYTNGVGRQDSGRPMSAPNATAPSPTLTSRSPITTVMAWSKVSRPKSITCSTNCPRSSRLDLSGECRQLRRGRPGQVSLKHLYQHAGEIPECRLQLPVRRHGQQLWRSQRAVRGRPAQGVHRRPDRRRQQRRPAGCVADQLLRLGFATNPPPRPTPSTTPTACPTG